MKQSCDTQLEKPVGFQFSQLVLVPVHSSKGTGFNMEIGILESTGIQFNPVDQL